MGYAIQHLFNTALAKGEKREKIDAGHEGKGSLIGTYREDIQGAIFGIDGFMVVAAHIQYQRFSRSTDARGIGFSLEIRKDEDVVLVAKRTGTGSVTKLSVDERIVKTDMIVEGKWKILQGAVPAELASVRS